MFAIYQSFLKPSEYSAEYSDKHDTTEQKHQRCHHSKQRNPTDWVRC